MSFNLEVEFAGLCCYLIHPDKKQVGVVMPDGRLQDLNSPLSHQDGTGARPHVGYLRFNLADAGVPVPGEQRDATSLPIEHPQYEGVHLFDLEELDFGLDFDVPLDPVKLDVVDLQGFAPVVHPKPGLFSASPPPELLMRTVLRGGNVSATSDTDAWFFDDLFKAGPLYTGRFAGSMIWKRTVAAEGLTLRIRSFDHKEKVALPLKPAFNNTIKLKIANLCADNPLEWEELGLRKTALDEPSDEDFKWFYRLWKHPDGEFEDLTRPRRKMLPHPILDHTVANNFGGGPNCECSMACWNYETDTPCPGTK